MPKLTREQFIERARAVHGDKYDYSKVEYVDSKTKVCIICPEHGEFLQLPYAHQRGQGCKLCSEVSKWTYDACFNEAKKYKSRSEFEKKSAGSYKVARINGWLDDYEWFITAKKQNGYWNEQTCLEESKKYKTRAEFQRGNSPAYQVARRNNWLESYTWLIKPLPSRLKWDYNTCLEESKKYKSLNEFRKKKGRAYLVALENGWIGEYTWLKRTLHETWTKESCELVAKQCKSISEFRQHSETAYNAALKNNWLKDYTWFEVLWAPCWDKETCYKEAKKYKTKRDFQLCSGSAFNAAKKNGWIDDYTWLVKLRHEVWTLESCTVESKKYSSYKEFKANSLIAYTVSQNKKWLEAFVWLENDIKKWTFEDCYIIAKKYEQKKDFYHGDSKAYQAARKHGWLDLFTWLQSKKFDKLKDYIDNVYLYYFSETRAIYVGRTIRPAARDKEHIFNVDHDTVASYAKDNNIPVPPMHIIESNLTIEKGLEREEYWVNYYKNQGYNILNKGALGISKGSTGALGYRKWSKKACIEEAKKYKTRSEFSNGTPSAYSAAIKHGWINEFSWIKEPVKKLSDDWNYEKCLGESKKYTSKTEFMKQCPRGFKFARQNGWLKDFIWLKRPTRPLKWTYESCFKEAQKFSCSAEFQKNNSSAYNAARRNGWIKDYSWFIPKHKPNGYWTYERCKEEALKYKTKKDFEMGSSTAYMRAVKHKWIDDYTWFIDTHTLLSKPHKWTKEMCLSEAKKYHTRGEFSDNNPSAYAVAKKNGWIDEYTWLIEKKKPNGYWTYERCKEEAKKYSSRSQMVKGSNGAYDAAFSHGWLDEFFPKK